MEKSLDLENRHTGEVLRMRRVRDAIGNVVLQVEGSLPPGMSGPPPHQHRLEREDVQVLSGTLGAEVGSDKIVVAAGGSAVFPAGVVHKWWNAGDDVLKLGGQVVPAVDLDRYLQGVFAVLNASAKGRPSVFYIAHVVSRHKATQMSLLPPPVVQRILFPVVLLIGRMLGKYRGDDWPGSPASCTGAPEVRAANS